VDFPDDSQKASALLQKMKTYITFGLPDWKFSDLFYAGLGTLIFRNGSKALEVSVNESMGLKHSCSTNLGRSAVQIALQLLGTEKKGKIILPTIICSTVIESVLAEGFEPILVDVDKSLHLSPATLDYSEVEGATGLIVAHLYGMQAPIRELEEWARVNSVFLIDDAAQAAGISNDDKFLGGFGDAGILSFGPFKSICTTRCGVFISQNPNLTNAARDRLMPQESSLGAIRRILSGTVKYRFSPWCHKFITDWRLKTIQSGQLRAQNNENFIPGTPTLQMEAATAPSRFEALLTARVISRSHNIISRRAKTCAILIKGLQNIPGIRVIGEYGTPYHKIPLLLDNPDNVKGLAYTLKCNRIESQRLYRPLHMHPRYMQYSTNALPTAEHLWNHVLLVPCPTYKPEVNSIRVILAIRNFMDKGE